MPSRSSADITPDKRAAKVAETNLKLEDDDENGTGNDERVDSPPSDTVFSDDDLRHITGIVFRTDAPSAEQFKVLKKFFDDVCVHSFADLEYQDAGELLSGAQLTNQSIIRGTYRGRLRSFLTYGSKPNMSFSKTTTMATIMKELHSRDPLLVVVPPSSVAANMQQAVQFDRSKHDANEFAPYYTTSTHKKRRVDAPVSNVAFLPKIDDNTERVLKNLRNRKMGDSDDSAIDMYPSAEACRNILNSKPLIIKVSKSDFDVIESRLTMESKNINAFQQNAHVSFDVTDHEYKVPTGLLNFLTNFDLSTHSWTGETEDEIHSFVETSITGPICKFFSPTLRISRNKALKTSSGRADYSISSECFQLFRGEDKMRSRMPKEDPMKELMEKSPKGNQWRMLYGNDVPYIFGYYSIGGTDNLMLQFVCIKEDSKKLIPLTDVPFDLTKFSGVFGCRCFMLAIIPHLLSLKEKINAPIGLEWKIRRTEMRGMIWAWWTVQIILDHKNGDCALAKDFYYHESQHKEVVHIVSSWKLIFEKLPISPHLMQLRRVDRRSPCPEEGAGRIRCVFAPLCRPESVSSAFDDEMSARLAILHVLTAIIALHKARLVHNDLRWANIVRKQGIHEYVLVDYDDMAMLDEGNTVPAIAWMDADSHAPDIKQSHDQNVDLWGLCKMMSEITCVHGDLSDIVEAGCKWLGQYPQLPTTFFNDVTDLCAKNV